MQGRDCKTLQRSFRTENCGKNGENLPSPYYSSALDMTSLINFGRSNLVFSSAGEKYGVKPRFKAIFSHFLYSTS